MDRVVTAIIFDLGKVIVNFDHTSFCKKTARHCALTPQDIYKKIFTPEIVGRFDRGFLSPEQFFLTARAILGLRVDISYFETLWSDIFSINEGIEQIIISLKQRFRLLCLSNTNQWHFAKCRRNFQILDLFDDFILSYKQGCCKPDPRIYHSAIAQAYAEPEQCIYIDDTAENVSVACALGINGIVFISVEKLRYALTDRGIMQ